MAQSITKTFTASDVSASGSVNIRVAKQYIEDDGNVTVVYNSGCVGVNYNGSATHSFDISAIPAGSTINSAKIEFTANKNAVCKSFGSTAQYVNATNASLTNANALSYLRTLSTFSSFVIKVVVTGIPGAYVSTSYRPSGWSSSGEDSTTANSNYARWTNLKLTVNYTPPDEATVSFGTGNVWKMCNVCMAVNNAWKKVKVFFGTGGSWKQVK